MIRVTIDLHVVSKGNDGSYWLSNLTQHAWEEYKKKFTWCKNDEELRADLRELGEAFILVRDNETVDEAITDRLGCHANVSHVRGWPQKIDLASELILINIKPCM